MGEADQHSNQVLHLSLGSRDGKCRLGWCQGLPASANQEHALSTHESRCCHDCHDKQLVHLLHSDMLEMIDEVGREFPKLPRAQKEPVPSLIQTSMV